MYGQKKVGNNGNFGNTLDITGIQQKSDWEQPWNNWEQISYINKINNIFCDKQQNNKSEVET